MLLCSQGRPGLHDGNAWTHPLHSFLGRPQSSGGDRDANRSFKNHIASDMGDVNSYHAVTSGEAPSCSEAQFFSSVKYMDEQGSREGLNSCYVLRKVAHKKNSVNY